jgi:PTH1 family peptidyl-tRNA hydrolase
LLLLVGLGNPGPKYRFNRHNIGFMALRAIAERYRFADARKKFDGLLAEGEIAGEKCLALLPTTYMNESGVSVGAAMRFYKLEPQDVIAFHDDLDLAPGKIRVKRGGGNAGHNGLRSMDAHIGADYRRVRLGIGHPGRERVTGHVLNDFTKDDEAWLKKMLEAIAECAPLLVQDDDPGFMSRVALLAPPPRPAAEEAKDTAG